MIKKAILSSLTISTLLSLGVANFSFANTQTFQVHSIKGIPNTFIPSSIVYSSFNNTIYTGDMNNQTPFILAINAENDKMIKKIPVKFAVTSLIVDKKDEKLFAGIMKPGSSIKSTTNSFIDVINLKTNQLATVIKNVEIMPTQNSLVYDSTKNELFAINEANNKESIVSTKNDKILRTVLYSNYIVPTIMNPNGNTVVNNTKLSKSTISILSKMNLLFETYSPSNQVWYGIQSKMVVMGKKNNKRFMETSIVSITPKTNKVNQNTSLHFSTPGTLWAGDDNAIFFTHNTTASSGTIYLLSRDNLSILQRMTTSSFSNDFVFDKNDNKVFFTNRGISTISMKAN
jgi:hypothetical protein